MSDETPVTPEGETGQPFSFGAEVEHGRDFRLLMNGPVNGYRRDDTLQSDLAELMALRYVVERFNCAEWPDEAAMHDEVAARLAFPGYYGRNLDALNDCLTDTDVLRVPAASGLAVALEDLDAWPGRQGVLVEIFAGASRYWSLFGRRIIVLVKVTDPTWTPPPHLADTRLSWRP